MASNQKLAFSLKTLWVLQIVTIPFIWNLYTRTYACRHALGCGREVSGRQQRGGGVRATSRRLHWRNILHFFLFLTTEVSKCLSKSVSKRCFRHCLDILFVSETLISYNNTTPRAALVLRGQSAGVVTVLAPPPLLYPLTSCPQP